MHQLLTGSPGATTRPAAGPAAPRPRARPSHVCYANYRWSAGSEDSSRRKRESLYGYDDNGEPLAGGSAATADGAADSSTAPAAWQGDWQQWQQGDGAQAPASAAWDAQQQQAWDAAAAFDAAPRRRRRERAADVAGSSEARTSRLSRRRQQRLEQQQAEEQQWLAEQEQQEQRQRGQQQAAGQEGDPWVEAELRQLRRRQTVRGGGAAEAADGSAAAAGKLPDPWAQEWGPLQGAPAAAAAQDWGWASESWAAGGAGAGGSGARRQRREEAAEADAGPGGSWDLRQQQREVRRRRRQAAAGDEDDEEAAAAGGQQAAYAAAGSSAQPRYGIDYDAELDGLGPEGEEYLEDNWGEEVPPGSAGWRARADGSPYAEDGGQYSRAYEPGLMAEPDIALLSEDELERVLPVVPSSQQAAFFSGSATDGVQRWGASLALTVLFSKIALLAATSLSWPLWWPWALAAKKNWAVRRQFRNGGLWRTQVLEVTTTGRPRAFSSTDEGGLLGSTMRMARVLVGDPGGAQAEMRLPYDSRYERIRPGEPAELMVLCNDTSFQSFKAVKDAYLPNLGLWVSEYPHCDRTQFLEVSLQVEREAQEAQDAQQWQQWQQQQQQAAAAQPSYSGSGSESEQAFYGQPGGWSQEEDYGGPGRY